MLFLIAGVAIGAGWQAVVAYVNIVCYYIFGVPLGLVMGYKLDMGVTVSIVYTPYVFDQNIILFETLVMMVNFFCLQGIWIGMLSGTVIQTLVLFWIVYRTNWNKEVIITSNKVIFCKQLQLIVYSVYTH